MSERDVRKKVLFVCIANACRSPMAEAIARLDAPDTIEAFSAGLEPIGYVAGMTKQTLIKNGCSVEGLESKSISPEVWEQADIVINMSGRPRERTFLEYSKVEDWEIEDPFAADPDTYQRVFEKIRLRVAELAQQCREGNATVRIRERRSRARLYPTSPMSVGLNGARDAIALNISEDGLALSADMILPNHPLHNMRIQFLGSPHWLEVPCRIAWKSKSNKQAGIQFIGLTEEVRWHIRNWISLQAAPANFQGQIDGTFESQNQRLGIPTPPQLGSTIPGSSAFDEVMKKHGKASPFSPTSAPTLGSVLFAALRTYARTKKQSGKKALRFRAKLARVQRNPAVPRQTWRTFATVGVLIGIISLTLKWATTQRNVRSETIPVVAQKTALSSEAVRPVAPPPATSTPTVPNVAAEKTEAQTPIVEPLPAEKVEPIQDIPLKKSDLQARAAESPSATAILKTPSSSANKALTPRPATKELPLPAPSVTNLPVEKVQSQLVASRPAIPPQSQAKVPSPVNLAANPPTDPPLIDLQEKQSPPPPKQPDIPVTVTGSVAVLADPYPSIRIPPERTSKKSREGTNLQLGHLVSRVEPVYPEEAKQQGIQGTVKLHAIIDRNGSVTNLEPVNGSPILVAAAMNAVRQWRYSETLLAGQSVETEEDIAIAFRLSGLTAKK